MLLSRICVLALLLALTVQSGAFTATRGRTLSLESDEPASGLAVLDEEQPAAFFALAASVEPSQTGASLSAVNLSDNSSELRGFLPQGEVISNGGGGVHGPSAAFATVTSRLVASGELGYSVLSCQLTNGLVTETLPLPEVKYVLWSGFGIRAAVDQRAQPKPRVAILAPTSNCTGNPCFYDFGVFSADFNTMAVDPISSLRGTPAIAAGGAAAFDSQRGRFWFVLGTPTAQSARHLYAIEMATGVTVVDTPLLQPPGLTLLSWDELTADIYGVGVTPGGSPADPSHFRLVRISGESGETIASLELPEGSAAGWRNLRVGNTAFDSSSRTLFFLVSTAQSPMNFLTLVGVNVDTAKVEQMPSFCRTGSARPEYRNCPLLIGQQAGTPVRSLEHH